MQKSLYLNELCYHPGYSYSYCSFGYVILDTIRHAVKDEL